MTETTIHHPSCPQRIVPGAGCGTGSDGEPCSPAYLCPSCIQLLEDQVDLDPRPIACLCGPEAAAEDAVILATRTPDQQLLDIVAHADAAATSWQALKEGPIARRQRALQLRNMGVRA